MPTETSTRSQAGFARRFITLTGGYWSSQKKWTVRLLTVALVGLTVCQVLVPVMINLWSKQLFDALEQRSMDRFWTMVMLVGGIIAFNVAITTMHLWVKRRLQLGWRQWLTRKLLDKWVAHGRHYLITNLPGPHDNPDGRIAEDIRITTEVAIELGHSLSFFSMLLISFTNILWVLSGAPEVTLGDYTFTVPGYLLYIALLYAAAGTTIAMLIGKPLVTAVDRRQNYEGNFRFGLARVRENALAISLLHGEFDERRRLVDLFRGVKQGWDRQTRALSNMLMFSSTYSVLSVAFPILIVAPRYISGAISLGVLMQTAQAFQQTASALSWPIDNIARAAEWKASVERVLGLHEALETIERDAVGDNGERISVERSELSTSLIFHQTAIEEPDGRPIIEPFDADIRPGERVWITGDPGAAIRLFKAVARVWPWGSGRITLPGHTRLFFMPQRPYLPRGPLREALTYPAECERISDDMARTALERVGLNHLLSRLDEPEAWEEVLAAAEQQRLGFARLLLRRPDWIFLEDATDALDPAGQQDMLRLLDEEFPASTILIIGNQAGIEARHGRKLVLERTAGTVHVREEPKSVVA